MAGKKKENSNVKSDNWGGKRKGAGRPRVEEQLRIKEILDENIDPQYVIKRLFDLIDNGDFRAIDLYLKHRVGMPKQSVDVHSTGDVDLNFKLNNIVSFDHEEDNEV